MGLKFYSIIKKPIASNDTFVSINKKHKYFVSLRYFYKSIKSIFETSYIAKKNKFTKDTWVNSSLNMLKACENAGADIEYKGMMNLKKINPPCIFVSNHMSTLETFLLPSIIQPIINSTYIMKKELVEMPVFGNIVRAIDPIVVGRSNPKKDLIKVIEEGANLIKEGISIIVFPQKTRSKFLDRSTFNSIGVKLANKNNVQIVPIAVLTDALNNGKIVKDFGKFDNTKPIKIEIGEPFQPSGNGKIDNNKVIDFIETKFNDWGKRDFVK